MNTRYILYARKSSESKERQALSVSDQVVECKEYAIKNDLKIIHILEEEKSAFKPNRREKFRALIDSIKRGDVDAILTWKPDRICRNPLEGGEILQLLQDGILKEIRTPQGDKYDSNGDTLILQIHFGMANQYSRNLSQNVKRGLERKAKDRHEYPRPAFIGYEGCGERGQRNIKPHPVQSIFIRKAFELASRGVYSYKQISDELYLEGFRSRTGKRVHKSNIARILGDTAYYGVFKWNGNLITGNYKPIITKELYDKVRSVVSNRSKPKKINWDKEFTGLIKCGECSCAITTSVKKKTYSRTKRTAFYTYHHCTHRRGACSQKPVTNSELKEMLLRQLECVQIDSKVWELGIKLVKEKYKDQISMNKKALVELNRQKELLRKRLNTLIDMRANGELTTEEFSQQKERIYEVERSLKNKSFDNDDSFHSWLELVENYFDTVFHARDVIEKGDREEKQIVLKAIGENFILKNKKLTFSFKKPFDVLLQPEYRSDVLRGSV